MTLDGAGPVFSAGPHDFDDSDRSRDEHPAVVLRDLERRRRGPAQVIVFANEKGGVGKSTLAFHCAVALAHGGASVLALDCDHRQRSLHKLLEARGGTARTLKIALPTPRHTVLDRQSGAMLIQEMERLGAECDFVLIDLAGHDSPIARRAIALADTVVTPINCSPADLDALGSINPVTGRFRHAAPFAEIVTALREERLARGGSAFDWVVTKNRVRHCEHRLLAMVNRNLGTMAERLGFRALAGLTERVGYRDLLPFGLTQLDLRFIPDIGAARSANLRELRELIEGLHLRMPASATRPPRGAKMEAPVLAHAAESYRQALRDSAVPGVAVTAA
jgi:chromosome partitioning protein